MPLTCCCKNVQIVFFLVVRHFFLQALGIYLSGRNFFFHLTLCLRAGVSKVAVTFPAWNQLFKSNRQKRIKARFS